MLNTRGPNFKEALNYTVGQYVRTNSRRERELLQSYARFLVYADYEDEDEPDDYWGDIVDMRNSMWFTNSRSRDDLQQDYIDDLNDFGPGGVFFVSIVNSRGMRRGEIFLIQDMYMDNTWGLMFILENYRIETRTPWYNVVPIVKSGFGFVEDEMYESDVSTEVALASRDDDEKYTSDASYGEGTDADSTYVDDVESDDQDAEYEDDQYNEFRGRPVRDIRDDIARAFLGETDEEDDEDDEDDGSEYSVAASAI